MSAHIGRPHPPFTRCRPDQAGLSLVELVISAALMSVIVGAMSSLVGAAIRGKMITAARSGNTETVRQSMEWMSERLRNAGLNLKPGEQIPTRCKDMVVAQDAALRPTANSLHVSGEIVNTDTIAGNEVITLGYFLGNDPATGTQVIMEYRRPCTIAPATITPLSDPRVQVTNLAFDYFSQTGTRITALADPNAIRLIRVVRVSLAVQGSQGRSGIQTQTWTRDVTLRNPEPNANDWKNPLESMDP